MDVCRGEHLAELGIDLLELSQEGIDWTDLHPPLHLFRGEPRDPDAPVNPCVVLCVLAFTHTQADSEPQPSGRGSPDVPATTRARCAHAGCDRLANRPPAAFLAAARQVGLWLDRGLVAQHAQQEHARQGAALRSHPSQDAEAQRRRCVRHLQKAAQEAASCRRKLVIATHLAFLVIVALVVRDGQVGCSHAVLVCPVPRTELFQKHEQVLLLLLDVHSLPSCLGEV